VATDTGPVFTTGTVPVPRIGNMFVPGDDYSKTFHGARLMKNNVQVNEVITCSFDPKTLNCLACPVPHTVLNANTPLTLCLSDQNFVPTLCCGGGPVPVPVWVSVPVPLVSRW
jgi:hypothetical protein